MPRKKFLACAEFPYHLTGRCLNKEWFYVPMKEVWDVYEDYLYFIHHAFGVRIHNFVLMNNHFHMIARTPNANLNEAMNYFMRETSRVIARKAGRINQIYGRPYHWSLIDCPHYYLHAYKYVYRNPIEAGLISKAETYSYSTLGASLGQFRSIIPLEPDETLFSDVSSQLNWLNQAYPTEELRLDIKKALGKHKFSFAQGKRNKGHILEKMLV